MPSSGDVVCARTPGISLNTATMSPGAFSILASIWSRSTIATGTAWSSMRRPVRVLATTVPSSCAVGTITRRTVRSVPATTSTRAVAGWYPSMVATTETQPGGQRQSADAGRVGRGGDIVCRDGRSLDRHGARHDFDTDRPGLRLCRISGPAGKAEAERKTSHEKGGQNGTQSGP